jgi:WXG100 family type VII secretion target
MCPDVTSFAVSPSDLQALDSFVASRAEHAHATVERLRAEAHAFFGDGWHGPAASAFHLAWEQWLDGARIVLAALDDTAALVGASAASYTGTDDAVRAAVGRRLA